MKVSLNRVMKQKEYQKIFDNVLSAWNNAITPKQCKHKFTYNRLCDNSKEYYCAKCGLVKS